MTKSVLLVHGSVGEVASSRAIPATQPSPVHYLQHVLLAYGQAQNVTVGTMTLTPDIDLGIDLARTWQAWSQLCKTHDRSILTLEGCPSSPITPELTAADLAWDWRIPTLLVMPVDQTTLHRAMSETIAQAAMAQSRRCPLQGLILYFTQQTREDTDIPSWWPPHAKRLEYFCRVPILGYLTPWQDPPNPTSLVQQASNLDLDCFF